MLGFALLALTHRVHKGYTTPAMRMLTSTVLAALILTLPLSVIAAPSQQATIDIKTLALTKADLPRGFEMVPDRTVSDERPEGVAVYDVTFARERTPENLSTGPFEVRSGVARTAKVDDAMLQLESTKEAFLGEGWEEIGVPALGDETLGLSQTTDGDGGQITHYSYLFRKDVYIVMVGIRGRPEATKLNDVVGLAITVSGRLDKALAGGAPASAGPPSASGPSTAGQSGTGERVRVINADGSAVNVRAEPSISASVVTQVSEGTTLEIVGPNRDAEGRTWRNVRTSGGQTGWIASTLLETVSTPPPPAPSPSPSAARSSAPAASTAPADAEPEDAETEGAEEVEGEGASASPTTTPTPTPAASTAGAFRGSGNGLTIEGMVREPNLSSGRQNVKVRVMRNGRGVGNAFVDVTARLDERRYRAFKLDRTNDDGYTEIEWDMEGPAGTYEVIVEVRTSEDGPATTAKGSFKWR